MNYKLNIRTEESLQYLLNDLDILVNKRELSLGVGYRLGYATWEYTPTGKCDFPSFDYSNIDDIDEI